MAQEVPPVACPGGVADGHYWQALLLEGRRFHHLERRASAKRKKLSVPSGGSAHSWQ